MPSKSNYRFDNRTKEQALKDIKNGCVRECQIAVRLGIHKYNLTGVWPEIIPSGLEVINGLAIDDDSKINTYPDFIIDGVPTEITNSYTECKKSFHQKIGKVNKCIKERADIVFANGIGVSKTPKTLILTASQLEDIVEVSKAIHGVVKMFDKTGKPIGKQAFRFDINWFDTYTWIDLPEINTKQIPKEYKYIISGG